MLSSLSSESYELSQSDFELNQVHIERTWVSSLNYNH